MKKYYWILFILTFTASFGNAQNSTEPVKCFEHDSVQSEGLSEQDFKIVLNRQFSGLINGQSQNSIGNYASADTKEGNVSFSGSSVFSDGSVLSFIFNGGVSDGLAQVFTNSKLNTKVSLECKYNLLANVKRQLTYNLESLIKYKNKMNQIRNNFLLDSLLIRSNYRRKLMQLDSTITHLNSIKDKLSTLISSEKAEHQNDNVKIDSLTYMFVNNCIQLDSLKAIVEMMKLKGAEGLIQDAKTDRNIQLKKLAPDIDISGFGFGWFSIGGKIQNNSFYLFNSSAAFNNQVTKNNFVKYEFNTQYSYYKWSSAAYESYFLCGGAALSYNNNLSGLTLTEISDIKYYGPNLNDRLTTNRYNAYTGEYKKDLKSVRLYGDYYKFFFNENASAFHFYPELQIKDKIKPVWNIGIGILMAFKDSKNTASNVNAELYYVFSDISNVTGMKDKLIERNNIGLRFSFPISFKTN